MTSDSQNVNATPNQSKTTSSDKKDNMWCFFDQRTLIVTDNTSKDNQPPQRLSHD